MSPVRDGPDTCPSGARHNGRVDAQTVTALLGPEGRALLDRTRDHSPADVFALTSTLRKEGHAPDLVAAALTQSALRVKAQEKFGPAADGMFFTADGVEQATRPTVARWHAERMVATGREHVVDLGCGIGSDALAFADAGLRVTAVDADPTTAAVAAANLTCTGATVETAQAQQTPLTADDAVWLDPARRTRGVGDASGRTRRTFSLDQLSPPWEFVLDVARSHPTGVKLSPSLAHSAVPDGAQAQWVSFDGTVVECVLWFGEAATASGRSAVVFRDGGRWTVAAAGSPEGVATPQEVREYVHEADRAVVRAGATGALVDACGGPELTPGQGYATSDAPLDLPWVRSHRVLDAMPYSEKTLRAQVRTRGVGVLTLKTRGVKIDEPALRRKLKLDGPATATVLVTPVGGRTTMFFLDPLPRTTRPRDVFG